MRIDVVNMNPTTNTAMDAQQWTDHLNAVPLDSRQVDEFAYVSECPCGTGGACCQVKLQMQITNTSKIDSLNVYSDDIVSSDQRVAPVNRTFNLLAMRPDRQGILVQTAERHTFSDGDLVTILDSVTPLPRFCKATQCKEDTLILQPLFTDNSASPNVMVDFIPLTETYIVNKVGESVGHITNRLLLYTLGPGQTVSWSAIARKGTAGAGTIREETVDSVRKRHIKWSPVTICYYRPLARDLEINSPMAKALTDQQTAAFIGTCPKRVFDIEDTIKVARPDDCNLCRACSFWARDNNLTGLVTLPVRNHPEWQQFVVKSNGSIDAYTIVRKAITIVREKLTLISGAAGAQLLYPAIH